MNTEVGGSPGDRWANPARRRKISSPSFWPKRRGQVPASSSSLLVPMMPRTSNPLERRFRGSNDSLTLYMLPTRRQQCCFLRYRHSTSSPLFRNPCVVCSMPMPKQSSARFVHSLKPGPSPSCRLHRRNIVMGFLPPTDSTPALPAIETGLDLH